MKPLALLTPHHIASLKPRDKEYAVDDAQCAGLRLRILPGGTKSWVIFRRIDGRPRRITLGQVRTRLSRSLLIRSIWVPRLVSRRCCTPGVPQ
jgi:hypothetical protein